MSARLHLGLSVRRILEPNTRTKVRGRLLLARAIGLARLDAHACPCAGPPCSRSTLTPSKSIRPMSSTGAAAARARPSRLCERFVQCSSPTCAASCAARSTSSRRTTTRRPTCRCAVARRCARAIDSSHHAPCHPHHRRARRRQPLRHRARHRRPRHPHALRRAPLTSNLRTPPTPVPPPATGPATALAAAALAATSLAAAAAVSASP